MGLYDHKAAIDYIRGQTEGSKIIFLGHSMATTSGLIYASLRPEEAKENIKAMILLAPVAYVDKVESILRYLSFFLPQIQVMVEVTNQHSLVAYDSWFANIIRRFAILFPFKILLVNLLAMIVGPHQFDPVTTQICS
jgi:pimeloyl-ACP methyl ester carboxylesterase